MSEVENAVFFSVFRRYVTYFGKQPIQFENNQYETSDPAIIKFLRECGDKNVTEKVVAKPVAASAAKPKAAQVEKN